MTLEASTSNPRRTFSVGNIPLSQHSPFFVIAGPCVIESERHANDLASRLKSICAAAGVPLIFKASYDKANRTSLASYRGPGPAEGLRILGEIRKSTGLPVLTDVHDVSQVEAAAQSCDVLQIPAFLSRQTDLLLAAAKTGRAVNIKKGQFLSPWDMRTAVEKIASTGNEKIMLTERGASFGYNNLVVDMRSISVMRQFGYPVIFDATHSVQLPGGQGTASGGQPEFIEPLARAAVAAGADGVFVEVHENPAQALSDGANALRLDLFEPFLRKLKELSELTRQWNQSAASEANVAAQSS